MIMIRNVNPTGDQHIPADDHSISSAAMEIELNARTITNLYRCTISHDFDPRSPSDAHALPDPHTTDVSQ
jgi:hypothetical protein